VRANRYRLFLLSLFACVPLCGCLSVAAGYAGGSLAVHSHEEAERTAAERAAFTDAFEKEQARRAAEGLPAMDWCNEVWNYERDWALEIPECKARPYWTDPEFAYPPAKGAEER
jgi:hypothetical protein